MKPRRNMRIARRFQRGAALVVSLLLMVVITLLAVSGMSSAMTGLALARNGQIYQTAFQAAESGIERALAEERFETQSVTAIRTQISNHLNVTTMLQFEETTPIPDRAFGDDADGFAAYHFRVTSTAVLDASAGNHTGRDATAIHTQEFYVVGPDSSAIACVGEACFETAFENRPVRTIWMRDGVE